MSLKILHEMFDRRLNSRSIMTAMSVRDYLRLSAPAYNRRGNIEGQRTALKSSTALRIRDRMRDDVLQGAVLPPIVLGVLVDTGVMARSNWTDGDLHDLLEGVDPSGLSIIDGMQRTTVLRDNAEALAQGELRLELWLVSETSSLTYRMLVLNTGQAPWNLRRQIEVVNGPLISEVTREMTALHPAGVELFGIDDGHRRTKSGEFQANDVVEMYIAFGLRKAKVEVEVAVVDQFSKLDMVEALADREFLPSFITVFAGMISLDLEFGRVPSVEGERTRLSAGRHLFDSQPACIGFMVAAAQIIFGRPGTTRPGDARANALHAITDRCTQVANHLAGLNVEERRTFLDFSTLNEILQQRPTGKIGDFERDVFLEAFRLFFTADAVESMRPCWRAL